MNNIKLRVMHVQGLGFGKAMARKKNDDVYIVFEDASKDGWFTPEQYVEVI